MADSPYIIEVNNENFQEVVIQGSMEHLVLVDFWADWCAPCKMLMPILSKLAEEYNGHFVLAKVNSDENQELSLQYGVRSLPTVKFFKQGQIIDEFMGAQAEPQIREMLDKHIVRESDRLRDQALLLQSKGNIDEAIKLLEQANNMDAGRAVIVADLARLYLEQEKLEAAQELLDSLPASDKQKPEISSLLTTIEFSLQASELPDAAQLQQKIEADANNLDARFQLATLEVNAGNHEAALEQLLEVLKQDRNYNEGAAREMLLKIFTMMGDSPLVAQYRRKMFNLLH